MYPIHTLRLPCLLLAAATLSLAVTGCRIERKPAVDLQKTAAPAGSFENKSFNPKADVQAMWEAKVLPAISAMAADFPELRRALQADVAAAGARHGHRQQAEGAPWNLAVRMTGRLVEVDTELSAGVAMMDVDGDGKADAELQIGPVIRGTTIRDILPFISFTSYANQIDFAQLANAFNDKAYEEAFRSVDRTKLQGANVQVLGVFTGDSVENVPTITVISIKVLP
ncbi:DUF2291 domain-containing protein [Comamonadaceae bacterium G21597-S1]|nr:DUF2291 domain-containing protein [Comamonadaceae bacterium G21597-S1]